MRSKNQFRLYSPIGAKPPFLILNFGFGMTLSRSISEISPKPTQVGQAPYGELNENKFGSGSG
ncbi:hypothetical protein D3C71_1129820 [compost metagenome]